MKDFIIRNLIRILFPIIAFIIGVAIMAGIGSSGSSGSSGYGEYSDVDVGLLDYLYNFGGQGKTYTIDGMEFYKTYDDGIGKLTVGRGDVYIDQEGIRAILKKGYVADSESGPKKLVNDVASYALSQFSSSGKCIFIEKELVDKANMSEVKGKIAIVETRESNLGTTFSMQQKYALVAIANRRL